jgi:hypothetical protein
MRTVHHPTAKFVLAMPVLVSPGWFRRQALSLPT